MRLPALRERDDFALLTEALLDGIAAETPIAPEAIARLAAEEWPGNIRELGNVLARLALVAPDGIGAEDVAEILAPPLDRSGSTGRQPGLRAGGDTAATLQEARTRQIEAVLREEGGNVSRAARRLGVSRNLIYRALGTGRRPPG